MSFLTSEMSSRNPPTIAVPPVVRATAVAVEAKLGRAPYIRQVKNGDEWFISDPVFSFVQHGFRKGATGYRVGLFHSSSRDELAFYMVHAPTMASVFKSNFSTKTLLAVAEATASFRTRSYMFWSSRTARKNGASLAAIESSSLADFSRQVLEWDQGGNLKRDLFPQIENQGNGTGKAKWAGNDFGFLLSERTGAIGAERIGALVDAAWPLFLLLYPQDALEQRVACLARNLLTAGVRPECEYVRIEGRDKLPAGASGCSGQLEGAHIKPHSLGGTDLATNGLWLCQHHHRLTEGLLIGDRKSPRLKHADGGPIGQAEALRGAPSARG